MRGEEASAARWRVHARARTESCSIVIEERAGPLGGPTRLLIRPILTTAHRVQAENRSKHNVSSADRRLQITRTPRTFRDRPPYFLEYGDFCIAVSEFS